MREWQASDRTPFAELNADAEVMRYFPAPLTRLESDALVDRIIADFKQYGWGLWALEERSTGCFLGFTGLARGHLRGALHAGDRSRVAAAPERVEARVCNGSRPGRARVRPRPRRPRPLRGRVVHRPGQRALACGHVPHRDDPRSRRRLRPPCVARQPLPAPPCPLSSSTQPASLSRCPSDLVHPRVLLRRPKAG
ncbi:MAG: GNAT family N-acetyltransferase [Solirubrobacterales bacterium]|nr:GNAT family N-acetyltransferase [Solirubrobacterales bacterium]